MLSGIKVGKAAANNSAVPFAAAGCGRIVAISTVGNAGTVFLGSSGVAAATGMAVLKDMVIPFGNVTDAHDVHDFSKWFVFSASTDGVTFIYI